MPQTKASAAGKLLQTIHHRPAGDLQGVILRITGCSSTIPCEYNLFSYCANLKWDCANTQIVQCIQRSITPLLCPDYKFVRFVVNIVSVRSSGAVAVEEFRLCASCDIDGIDEPVFD